MGVSLHMSSQQKTMKPIAAKGYRISLSPKNVIEVAFIGDQTVETVDASIRAILPYQDELIRRGKPVLFVIDYGKIGHTTIAANQRAVKAMKELTFRKMAGINAKPVIRFITNTIASVTGDSNRARHFKTREEAEQWLLKK